MLRRLPSSRRATFQEIPARLRETRALHGFPHPCQSGLAAYSTAWCSPTSPCSRPRGPSPYSDETVANRTVGISGGRKLNPFNTIVACTKSYTYAAKLWALCTVQGHFPSPRAKSQLIVQFATFAPVASPSVEC
jgi:hypothetical protein